MSFKTLLKLFAAVVPILDYALVWGFHNFNVFENEQNKAKEYFLGVHRHALNTAVNADLVKMQGKTIYMARYWNRLIDMDDERLPKIILNA